MPSMGSEPTLQSSSDSAKRNSVHGQPSVTLDTSTKESQTTVHPPLLSGAEQQETALPEIDRKPSSNQATLASSLPQGTELQETTLPGPILSTPVRKIGRAFQSPLSNNQTATPYTALFTPTINREVLLSPLTKDDQTPFLVDKVEMTLQRIPSPQQQASLCNTTSTQAEPVDEEHTLPIQDY
jgi:hypothetical protein